MDRNKAPVTDRREMAELLSSQYASVFSNPMTGITEENVQVLTGANVTDTPTLSDIYVATDDVPEAVTELSNGAAPGPDGVPTLCYKRGGGHSDQSPEGHLCCLPPWMLALLLTVLRKLG
jgi:hypothetical protein